MSRHIQRDRGRVSMATNLSTPAAKWKYRLFLLAEGLARLRCNVRDRHRSDTPRRSRGQEVGFGIETGAGEAVISPAVPVELIWYRYGR